MHLVLICKPTENFISLYVNETMGLKLNFELKLRSFNLREVTHFYNKT